MIMKSVTVLIRSITQKIIFICVMLSFMSIHAIAKDVTLTFLDGSKYVGQAKGEVPHGKGRITWVDGSEYFGAVREGKPHGVGIYTWTDGAKYEGGWENGVKHGNGTYFWASGSKYTGQWRNDKVNGRGTMTWADGRKYVGQWENDKQHGKGTMTHPDGKVQDGQWIHGEFQEKAPEPELGMLDRILKDSTFSAWAGRPFFRANGFDSGAIQIGIKGHYHILLDQPFDLGLGAVLHYTEFNLPNDRLRRIAIGADVAAFYTESSISGLRPYLRTTCYASASKGTKKGIPFEMGLGAEYTILPRAKLFAEFMYDFRRYNGPRMRYISVINVGVTIIPDVGK